MVGSFSVRRAASIVRAPCALVAPVVRVAWVALWAVGCGPTGNDTHVGARATDASEAAERAAAPGSKRGAIRSRKHSGNKASNKPKLDGTRCAAFVPFLPATVEGYRAKGPAEGSDFDLGEGAAIAVLRRGYFKPGISLDIEIVDTERGKRLRDVFEQTRAIDRSTETAVIKPATVLGHKAVAQWNSTTKGARVSVLLESRYLVNLHLRPATDVEGALAAAHALNLAELAQLRPSEQIAAQ